MANWLYLADSATWVNLDTMTWCCDYNHDEQYPRFDVHFAGGEALHIYSHEDWQCLQDALMDNRHSRD